MKLKYILVVMAVNYNIFCNDNDIVNQDVIEVKRVENTENLTLELENNKE